MLDDFEQNIWPLERALAGWEPPADALEFYGNKLAAWLSDPDWEALDTEAHSDAEWSVGYIMGAAAALRLTAAQLLEEQGYPFPPARWQSTSTGWEWWECSRCGEISREPYKEPHHCGGSQ
jgi:hypothetical protein